MTRPTILAYHALGDCRPEDDVHNLFLDPAVFEQQMEYLAANKRVVPLDDVTSGKAKGRGCIAITFDDGYRNVARFAAPVLSRLGLPATIFVPTAFLGARNTWIDPTPCDVDIMTMDELRELEASGITSESHGHGHIDYEVATEEEARDDLARSRSILSEGLSRDIRHFAYPYGRSSTRSRAVARGSGLTAAYSIDRRHEGPFAWERVQITRLDGHKLFAFKCSGYYHLARRSRVGEGAYFLLRPVARALRR